MSLTEARYCLELSHEAFPFKTLPKIEFQKQKDAVIYVSISLVFVRRFCSIIARLTNAKVNDLCRCCFQVLEETIAELRRNVAATKQEEEALLSEMDVTGQAFEDMQEQNLRLLQQLREKDDANFKLMSEVKLIVRLWI